MSLGAPTERLMDATLALDEAALDTALRHAIDDLGRGTALPGTPGIMASMVGPRRTLVGPLPFAQRSLSTVASTTRRRARL